MLVKAKRYLEKEALIALYYSFVYPYLTYCNHIWDATYVSNFMKLIKLQMFLQIRLNCFPNRIIQRVLFLSTSIA